VKKKSLDGQDKPGHDGNLIRPARRSISAPLQGAAGGFATLSANPFDGRKRRAMNKGQ